MGPARASERAREGQLRAVPRATNTGLEKSPPSLLRARHTLWEGRAPAARKEKAISPFQVPQELDSVLSKRTPRFQASAQLGGVCRLAEGALSPTSYVSKEDAQ